MTLIDRLSKLNGPDREVDALIECEAGDEYSFGHRLGKNNGSVIAYFNRSNGDIGHGTYKAPAYTASVDAAIALAERVLPFTHLVSTYHDDMACSVKIHCCPEGLSGEWKFDVKGDHGHLAVAYCIATLRAIALLRAKEASK